MYSHTFRIIADDREECLRQALENLPAMENIKVETEFRLPSGADCQGADLAFVFDKGAVEGIKKASPGARVILCLTPEEERKLPAELAGMVDDIWLLPLHPARIGKRVFNILNEMGMRTRLKIASSWLDVFMDSIPDMAWIKNLEGRHIKVNQAFCKAAGKTKRMIENRLHGEIWGGDDAGCGDTEREVIRAGRASQFDEILKVGNESRQLKTYKAPLKDANGAIVGTIGIAHDVTNMLNLSMEIEIFVEAMPFPLLVINDEGVITHLNGRFMTTFGENKEDMVDTNYDSWKDWAFRREDSFMEGGQECLVFEKDGGSPRLFHVVETKLRDIFGNQHGMVAAFNDITAEKELERQIWKIANEDTLTGLANRHALAVHMKKMKDQPFHLLYIDLDNFKQVNDRFGHKAGDNVLKKISGSMREHFPDDFLVRLGGDEFLIVIERQADLAELEEKADGLRERLVEWFSKNDQLREVSISVGIRNDCDPAEPIDNLIREADMAMYRAKKSGKARTSAWKAGDEAPELPKTSS